MNADEMAKQFDADNSGSVREARQEFPPSLVLNEKVGNFVRGIVTRVRKGQYDQKATLSYTIRVAETNGSCLRTTDKVDPNTGWKIKEAVELPENKLVELKCNSDLIKKEPKPVEGQDVLITFLEKKRMGKAPMPTAFYSVKLGKVVSAEPSTADSEI